MAAVIVYMNQPPCGALLGAMAFGVAKRDVDERCTNGTCNFRLCIDAMFEPSNF